MFSSELGFDVSESMVRNLAF